MTTGDVDVTGHEPPSTRASGMDGVVAQPEPPKGFVLRWAGRFAGALSAIVLFGLFAWLGTRGSLEAWTLASLPAIYLLASVLYRYEDRLPGWLYRLLDIASEHIVTISWLKKKRDVFRDSILLVEDLETTLAEYGLTARPAKRPGVVPDGLRNKVTGSGRVPTVRWISKQVAPQVDPSIDRRVLELLHDERSGLPTLTAWPSVRRDHLDDVVRVLPSSDRLPPPTPSYRYVTAGEIRALVASLRDFDVGLLARELTSLSNLAGRAARMVDFYRRSKIAVESVPKSLAAEAGRINGLPTSEATMFRIDDPQVALEVLKNLDGTTDGSSVPVVRLGVFLREHEPDSAGLLSHLCRQALADEPIGILHGYLWEKHARSAHAGDVALEEISGSWLDWEKAAERKLGPGEHNTEHARLKSQLTEGRWPTFRDDRGRFHTVEAVDHDEVREHDAYLITFDGSGPIAMLIDCLMYPSRAPKLKELGVGGGNLNMYRFGKYTKNTRLGILPEGMPFHEFHETFARDMALVLGNRKALFTDPWRPAAKVRHMKYGEVKSITLTASCPGPVTFRITQPPMSGGKLFTRHGRLTGPPQQVNDNQAVVTYVANAPEARKTSSATDSFDYEYTDTKGRTTTETIELMIYSHGYMDLEQFEITLDRIDLAHCRELRFSDPALGVHAKSPSICDVWEDIVGQLDSQEVRALKPVFDRAAGGSGC